MVVRYVMFLAACTLAAAGALASDGPTGVCDEKLTASLHECERIVGSLRPDKAGQMRVFASDGSEFTADQATWMKSQLKQVSKACAEGDVEAATRRLAEVQQLITEHHRPA